MLDDMRLCARTSARAHASRIRRCRVGPAWIGVNRHFLPVLLLPHLPSQLLLLLLLLRGGARHGATETRKRLCSEQNFSKAQQLQQDQQQPNMLATRTLGMQQQTAARPVRATPIHRAPALARPLVCQALKQQAPQEEPQQQQRASAALVAVLASVSLLASGLVPEDAQAARSGGRMGGSGGFRASRAAPRAAPAQ